MKAQPLPETPMNAVHSPLGEPTWPRQPRIRVVVFGSFLGGFHVLRELLVGPLARRIDVVGVATDDPRRAFTHPKVRLWKYPHSRDDELLVPRLARVLRLPLSCGRVRSREFRRTFLEDWQPELCLMATFGQKIPDDLIAFPRLGFCNFHHSGDTWPSYPGPDPIAALVRDRREHLVLTLHRVTSVIDGGGFVARSHPVPIPDGVNAVEMHRITWPQMGPFIRGEVGALLDAGRRVAAQGPLQLHEEGLPYRVQDRWGTVDRLAA